MKGHLYLKAEGRHPDSGSYSCIEGVWTGEEIGKRNPVELDLNEVPKIVRILEIEGDRILELKFTALPEKIDPADGVGEDVREWTKT